MSWRETAKPYESAIDDWRSTARPSDIKGGEKELSAFIRSGVTIPAEIFGGAVGSIPSLATAQSEYQPIIELLENLSRPEFLSGAGLEPAPEKGLSNLLAAIGRIPGIENITVPALRKRFEETTEEKFKPRTAPERVLAHGASAIGQASAFGGAGSLGIASGALIGQTARELGIPPKIANILECVSSGVPKMGKKQVLPNESEKMLVEFARKKGLTETEITPLLKGEFSQDILAKLAFKGPRTKKIVSGIESKMGPMMSGISEEASKMPRLNQQQTNNLVNKFEDVLYRLEKNIKPSAEEEKAAEFVKGAIEKLRSVGADPEEMVNFWRSLNRDTNWNKISEGKKLQFQLKDPLMETFQEINPKFAREFELSNELYKKFKNVESSLQPDLADKFKLLGTAGTLFTGIVTLNVPTITTALGASSGQLLARELLVNPRLQALHKKAIEAANTSNIKMANTILQQFSKELQNKYPKEFKNLDFGKISEPSANSTEK